MFTNHQSKVRRNDFGEIFHLGNYDTCKKVLSLSWEHSGSLGKILLNKLFWLLCFPFSMIHSDNFL